MREDDALPAGLMPAALVAVAGFGAMTLQWQVGHWDSDLPDHWDYVAGTWGDALVLPATVGLLWRLANPTGLWPGTARPTSVGAIVGALAGTATQAAWLADPDPRLNWVLPAPHQFSGVGWYHASFLVAVSALVGGCAARFVSVRRNGSPAPSFRSVAATFASATTFAGLVVVDSAPSLQTTSSRATVTVVAATTAATAVGLPLLAGSPRLIGPALLGTGIGALITTAILLT